MSSPRGLHAGLFYETLFWDDGPRPPMVLLPGLMSDGRQVRRLLRELGRKAIVIDPLGSGRSEAPTLAADYALPSLVLRLDAVLDELLVTEADLIGLSMGGMWAQHALVKRREVKRWRSAVLVGSSARIGPRLRSILLGLRAIFLHEVPRIDVFRVLQALLFSPDFLDRPSTVPLLELLASESGTTRQAALHQLDAILGHDLYQKLSDVGGVRLVLGGQKDVLMTPSVQAELGQALSGVAVEILEDVGHAMWIEQPAALCATLSAALPD